MMNIPNQNINYYPQYYRQAPASYPYAQPQMQPQNYYSIYANNPNVYGVNNAIKAQTMLNKGYTELQTFQMPFLTYGKMYQLNNGQKVVIIPKKGPTTIKTFANVGSFNETDNIRGISHYIEHNLFNGSKGLKPNEFVEKVGGVGGKYNASTGYANTSYYITSPLHGENDLENFVKMHADMMENPTFAPDMLEKEKGPVTSEIQMYQDNAFDKTYNTMLKNLFNIKADYQGLIAGSVDNIRGMTKEKVEDYYNKFYTPDNMTTVIVGEVNPDETIKLVSKYFTSQKQSAQNKYHEDLTKPLQSTRRVDIQIPNCKTPILTMGFIGPANSDIKSSLATKAMIQALIGHENAVLTKDLKSLNTDADMSLSPVGNKPSDPQVVELYSTFENGQEEEGLNAIYSSLYKIAQNPISQTELEIIKNKMKNEIAEISEDSMNIADVVGGSIVSKGSLESYTSILQGIDNLRAEDVQLAARRYLDLNKVSIVMGHPQSAIQSESVKKSNKLSFCGLGAMTGSKNLEIGNISEYNLANNIHLAFNSSADSIKTSASLNLKTANVPQVKPGVAELLSMMMNKGTKYHTEEQLSEISNMYNVNVGVSASPEELAVAMETLDNSPLALSLMKEMLFAPDLTEEKLQKVKQELKLSLSSMPENAMDKAVEVLYENHPYGFTPRKILENIDNISLQDVQSFYSYMMQTSQANAAVTTPASKSQRVLQQVSNDLQATPQAFQSYQYINSKNISDINKDTIVTTAEDRTQAHVVQAFKVNESGNIYDKASLLLMNKVLGGCSQARLFQDLREKQKLAYMVNSQYMPVGDKSSVLLLQIMTSTKDTQGDKEISTSDNIKKSLDGFKKHIEMLKTTPVGQKELESAKLSLKSDLMFAAESSMGKTSLIGQGLDTAYGSKYAQELLKVIDEIQPENIQSAANAVFNKPSVISVIADKQALEDNFKA